MQNTLLLTEAQKSILRELNVVPHDITTLAVKLTTESYTGSVLLADLLTLQSTGYIVMNRYNSALQDNISNKAVALSLIDTLGDNFDLSILNHNLRDDEQICRLAFINNTDNIKHVSKRIAKLDSFVSLRNEIFERNWNVEQQLFLRKFSLETYPLTLHAYTVQQWLYDRNHDPIMSELSYSISDAKKCFDNAEHDSHRDYDDCKQTVDIQELTLLIPSFEAFKELCIVEEANDEESLAVAICGHSDVEYKGIDYKEFVYDDERDEEEEVFADEDFEYFTEAEIAHGKHILTADNEADRRCVRLEDAKQMATHKLIDDLTHTF